MAVRILRVVGLVLLLLTTNCGKKISSFSARTDLDSVEERGLTCVSGERLGIWLDPDKSGKLSDDNYLGSVVAYSGSTTAAVNYDYYSASAHPAVGPQPQGFETNVFFYSGSDGLALTLFSNIDEAGSTDNIVNLDVQISGNAKHDEVLLSDDGDEMALIKRLTDVTYYEGRFHYWRNTDGAVLGPLTGTDYKIRVQFLSTGDIQNARFYSANGRTFTLKDKQNKISSFVIAYKSYEDCED
jgi:hypothetical protein